MEGHPHRQDPILIPEDLDESFQPVIGAPVTLRPLRPEDADIESAFVEGLSPGTRANRLLGGAIRITREYIQRLTTIDYRRDMALAAVVMLGDSETLIGVARYVAREDMESCEFAIVVADLWQGRGIGARLLEKLIRTARGRGFERMEGEILSSNAGMLALARRSGFSLSRHPEDATVTLATLALQSVAPQV